MDGIQPYHQGASVNARPVATPVTATPVNPAAAKTPSDYLRALRRRFWAVLMVAVPLAVAATVWVLRMPAVYQAEAMVLIEPPQIDPVLSTLVSRDVGQPNRDVTDRYLPNRVAQLKSKALAERVVNDPAFLQGAAPPEGAAEELLKNLATKYTNGTNWVKVTLDGTDPAKVAKQLSTLLEIFARDARLESETKNDDTRSFARRGLETLKSQLRDVEVEIGDISQKAKFIGPGGSNIFQDQYLSANAILSHKRVTLDETKRQAWIGSLFPKTLERDPEELAVKDQIARLQESRRLLVERLQEYRRVIRNFDGDPAVKQTAAKLDKVIDNIEYLKSSIVPKEAATDPAEMLVNAMQEELRALQETADEFLNQFKESMPEHQRFLALQDERERMRERVYGLETKILEFDTVSKSQKQPVQVYGTVAEPVVPIRPKRLIYIAIALLMSLGAGIGLVCLLEHVDHSVKVPEHLSAGLTLPLLGVIPRIRRTALVQRGAHLWTPGDPGSVEADAFRNLRASLLGASDRIGPITTLLVTSAKAGEGKSTTALNLAATCARAGERTLLMDVDLRRPSLRGVFDDESRERGLVDVLRGALPWQRTLVRTDVPNLDFLPTGDATGIPIEILGTLELRQLVIALGGHYDRVILDGPAVLGLADCRMLGRVVDCAVMVVRSGAHELRPLQRAKAMLEQSHVLIAGVIFNGLAEDLQNWSSYGPYEPYAFSAPAVAEGRRAALSASGSEAA
ncbi:MAG: GumC family protein [Isosphaeraceae bacterium]